MLGSIKSGPILEYPLIEHNAQRQLRPIRLNIRKVQGKRGWLLRRFGRFLAPDPTDQGLGHHGLRLGEYAHELHTDEAYGDQALKAAKPLRSQLTLMFRNQKYLIGVRLTATQIWEPTVTSAVVGYCSMTDEEIAIEGRVPVMTSSCTTSALTLLRRHSYPSPVMDARSSR